MKKGSWKRKTDMRKKSEYDQAMDALFGNVRADLDALFGQGKEIVDRGRDIDAAYKRMEAKR